MKGRPVLLYIERSKEYEWGPYNVKLLTHHTSQNNKHNSQNFCFKQALKKVDSRSYKYRNIYIKLKFLLGPNKNTEKVFPITTGIELGDECQ